MRSYEKNKEIEKQKLIYLAGLKRFKSRGVAVVIDGVECPEEEWGRIFEVGEDGAFYMGDYVCSDQGGLEEIRFDRVHISDPLMTKYR